MNKEERKKWFSEIDFSELKSKNDPIPTSIEFHLGYYIGEYILHTKLPTLSIDMLKTRNVINVSVEEENHYRVLEENWYENRNNLEKNNEWETLNEFRYKMSEKYLPKVIETQISYIFSDKMDEIKNGIMCSLYESDLCSYKISTLDDIKITPHEKYGFSIVELTRNDK